MLSTRKKEDVVFCSGADSLETISSVNVCNGSEPEQRIWRPTVMCLQGVCCQISMQISERHLVKECRWETATTGNLVKALNVLFFCERTHDALMQEGWCRHLCARMRDWMCSNMKLCFKSMFVMVILVKTKFICHLREQNWNCGVRTRVQYDTLPSDTVANLTPSSWLFCYFTWWIMLNPAICVVQLKSSAQEWSNFIVLM